MLRTRNSKMPYKYIAAHLQKTELACRLHYHQMTFGNSRRKRADSTSSSTSSSKRRVTNFQPYDTPPDRSSSIISRDSPSSDPVVSNKSPEWHILHSSLIGGIHHRNGGNVMLQEERTLNPASTDLGKVLRLDTAFATPLGVRNQERHQIDIDRLQSIYRANRQTFWANIASQYSAEQYISPLQLEQAFFAIHQSSSALSTLPLPTPNATPKVSPDPSYSAPILTAVENSVFNAINRTPIVNTALSARSPGRCAVSALLNEPLTIS